MYLLSACDGGFNGFNVEVEVSEVAEGWLPRCFFDDILFLVYHIIWVKVRESLESLHYVDYKDWLDKGQALAKIYDIWNNRKQKVWYITVTLLILCDL